jgi:lysozyme
MVGLSFAIAFIGLFFFIYWLKNKGADTFHDAKYTVKGIDLSHHNPIPDWNNLKEQNIAFAYVKATEGITHDDRNYLYNYKYAKQHHVKIGSYHFYNFGVSGQDQAKHFIKVAQCNTGDLLPAIDVEHSSANPYSKDTAFVKTVIEELKNLENRLYEHYGVHPVLYTNPHCYKLYIRGNFLDNFIWISSPDKEPPNDIANWIIWQFSHKGKLHGIGGYIDLNYFRYPFQQINRILLP